MTFDMDMAAPSLEESKAFFRGAKISPQSLRPRTMSLNMLSAKSELSSPTSDDSDVLVGKDTPAVLGFSDNVSEDNRQAAKDSIHFSERYADLKADIKRAPIEWHAHYREAMRHCGWTMTAYKYGSHTTSQTNVTMEAIVLDIVNAVAGANASAMLNLVRSVFSTIKADDKLIQLFENTSKGGETGEFRIVPCLQSRAGTAITLFLAVDCKLKSSEGGAWFWKWKWSQVKLNKVATMVELNRRVHLRNQDLIYDVLDKDSEAFFEGAKKLIS
ncbi:hypothetical protein ACN1C3_17175 [Pseudomonas sp. H11T01]|uniref:hypothetical protein n=1 Tax=Pseudomonas sp. H11T01 TaxID=3402749 RepID=UPI003AC08E94